MSKPVRKLSQEEYHNISLFKNPIETLRVLLVLLLEQLSSFLRFVSRHVILVLLISGSIWYLNFVDGSHSEYNRQVNEFLYFACYWILLGIASSIGLGTGLHTFVLYLGPHIAKVTMAANECSYFPVFNPNRWNFKDFLPCDKLADQNNPGASFLTILLNVQLEAFLWGLGTAIGELPPYYMAKAASEAGIEDEEFEELETLEKSHEEKTLIERAKVFIYRHLKQHGFITVLICASIPNPLFDLAGITCGHFRIPFLTFFGATAIGKAIIKVHLQTVFIIVTFSKHHIESVLSFFEAYIPALQGILTKTLEKQKNLLWNHKDQPQVEADKPLIATIWEIVITVMIVYFLISIINSVVNERRKKEQKEKHD